MIIDKTPKKLSKDIKQEDREVTEMHRTQLIQETDVFTKKCYDSSIAEIVEYDLMQFVCFLVVIDLHVGIRNVKIDPFLEVFGVPYSSVWATFQRLERFYLLPRSMDIPTFIHTIAPVLLHRYFPIN